MTDFYQALLFTVLHLNGAILANGIRGQKNASACFSTAIGFFYGLIAYVLVATFSILIGAPFIVEINLAVSIGLGFFIGRRGFTREFNFHLISTGIVVFVVSSFLTSFFRYSSMSFDSITQILIGYRISWDHVATHINWPSWGVTLPIAHSLSKVINENYLSTLNLITISVFFWVVFSGLGQWSRIVKASKSRAAIVCIAASLFCISTPFIWLNVVYIHNNLLSGILLAIFLMLLTIYLKCEEPIWAYWSIPFAVGFGLARNENPLVLIVFLACLHFTILNSSTLKKVSLFSLLPPAVWQIYLFCQVYFHSGGGSILNTSRSIAQVLIILIFILATIFSSSRLINNLWKRLPWITVTVLITALGGSVYLKPSHMQESLSIFIQNLFFTGYYGISWYFFGFLFLLLSVFKLPKYFSPFYFGIPSYLILTNLFAFFRAPYVNGTTDSGNRIALHILLVSVVFFSMFFLSKISCRKWIDFKHSRIAMMITSSALLIFVVSLINYHPINLMRSVIDIEGAGMLAWKPPKNLILPSNSSVQSNSFTQADSGGVRTITFTFDGDLTAKTIVIHDVGQLGNQNLLLIDYELKVSSDKKIWTTIFNTRDLNTEQNIFVRSNEKLIEVPESMNEFKFLRLVGRKSTAWQGRFILKRVELYSESIDELLNYKDSNEQTNSKP